MSDQAFLFYMEIFLVSSISYDFVRIFGFEGKQATFAEQVATLTSSLEKASAEVEHLTRKKEALEDESRNSQSTIADLQVTTISTIILLLHYTTKQAP